MALKYLCVLVISLCPKTASTSPDRFLYSHAEMSRLCHRLTTRSCEASGLPEEHNVEGILTLQVKKLKLLSHVWSDVACQIEPTLSRMDTDEKLAFIGSCLESMRRFVVEMLKGDDVNHKVCLGVCALCPTVVEVSGYDVLFKFVGYLTELLGSRGYHSVVEKETLVSEYQAVVVQWRGDWERYCQNMSDGIQFWLGESTRVSTARSIPDVAVGIFDGGKFY